MSNTAHTQVYSNSLRVAPVLTPTSITDQTVSFTEINPCQVLWSNQANFTFSTYYKTNGSTLNVNDIFYTDTAGTTVLDGDNNWYADGNNNGLVLQVSSTGVILQVTTCFL